MVQKDYSTFVETKYGSDVSTQPVFDVESWVEATGASKKGRVYGFGTGSYAKSIVKSVDSVSSRFLGESSSAATLDNLQRMLEEVREEVRQELQQEMQEIIRKANMEMEERIEERIKAAVVAMSQQQNMQPQSPSSE